MKRTIRIAFVALVLALVSCSDDTPEKNNGTVDAGSDSAADASNNGGNDTGGADATQTDTGDTMDVSRPDAANPDSGNPDTGNPDTGNPDSGNPDTGNPDTGNPDTGNPDTGADMAPDTGADMAPDTGPDMGVDTGPDMPMTTCGDGVQDTGEQCDWGTSNDDRGNGTCRTSCVAPFCGDGVVDWILGEICDDGGNSAGDGCDANCQLEVAATCGDSNLDAGEDCDNGAANSDFNPDACRSNCTFPRCGDAVGDSGEECDDGNVRDGDGCSANCTIEPAAVCGDGFLDIANGEECDDGGNVAGDGCSTTCQLEGVGATCGDSSIDASEVCDDGNTTNGDGCNPTCNLLGYVTNMLPLAQGGVSGPGGMAVDQDYLWVSDPANFTIGRIALDNACLQNGTCNYTVLVGTAGTRGYVDADGTAAQIGPVESMATDGSTVWFFDGNHTLRAFPTTAPYTVTTVAGDPAAGAVCDAVDGIGTAARFHGMRGLTYYDSMVYMLDGCVGVLRRFDPSTNEVLTIAGTAWSPTNPAPPTCPTNFGGFSCNAGPAADGYGTAGALVSPRYMASDNNGMLYITDTNGETIRTYNVNTGYLGTLAGSVQGYVDAVGTAAQLDRPRGLTSDGTSLYWGEQNEHTVRQVITGTAEVSTLAGRRGCAGNLDQRAGGTDMTTNCNPANPDLPRFNTPWNIVFHYPSNSLYVRDANGIRRIE